MTPQKPDTELRVGSTVWVFDQNHRVYPPTPKGRLCSDGPIYREHWVARQIVGDNKATWLLNGGHKVPKRKDPDAIHLKTRGRDRNLRVAVSLQEVDDDCWANDRRRDVVRAVERCDIAALRQIAGLLGVEE